MNNIHQTITSHNKTALNNEVHEAEQTRSCNCRNKTCLLQGKCLQKDVRPIYQTTIMQSNTGKQDTYIVVTENEFKTRYNQHISSYRLEHRKKGLIFPNGKKLLGRPNVTKDNLAIVFNIALALIQHPNRLHPSKDLAEIRPSTGQETLEWISPTDRESCRSVTD